MTTLRPHRVLFIAVGVLAWSCFVVRAQEEEAVSNALTAVDIIRLGDPDDDMIVGEAGSDYPTYAEVPNTAFRCEQQGLPGYYADQETQCQVFHICVTQGRRLEQFSFLCPNGTIFNQQYLVCVWWYDFDCSQASSLYRINADIFGDTPSTFSDDGTGTAAASAIRDRPATSRFPVRGGVIQGDLSDNGDRTGGSATLPLSPRDEGTGGRGRFPTVANGLGTAGGLPTADRDQDTRRGLTTPVSGPGTRGRLPSSLNNQGARGGSPTLGAGQGPRGGLPTAAVDQSIGGGPTSLIADQSTRGGLFGSENGQVPRGEISQSLLPQVSSPQELGGFPGTFGVSSRPGTLGSIPDSGRGTGFSGDRTGAAGVASSNLGPETTSLSQISEDASKTGGFSGFVDEPSITPGFGISQPGTSDTSTTSQNRPVTAGVSSSGIRDIDGEGRPVVTGGRPSAVRITGSNGTPGLTDGFTSPVRETGTTGTGLPSRSATTGESPSISGGPGTTGNFIDTEQGFSPFKTDTSTNVGSAGSDFPPGAPGESTTFTNGLGSTRLSGQISEPGATSGIFGLPGSPDTTENLIGSSGKPGQSGFIGSPFSPAAFGGELGTPGLSPDSSSKPVTTGGFISSLGTPGTTGFPISSDGPSSTGGFTSSFGRPGTITGITGTSGIPATGDKLFLTTGKPGITEFTGNVPSTTAGFADSTRAPGVEIGIGGVNNDLFTTEGIRDSVSGQGLSDIITFDTRPETTDTLISPTGEILSSGISIDFPTETLSSVGLSDGTISYSPEKPEITPGQNFFETNFGSSPSVSGGLTDSTGSITDQFDSVAGVTSPGIRDSLTSSISSSGSPGYSSVRPPSGGSFETFQRLGEDPVSGFDSSLGTLDVQGVNTETETETGQYDQTQDAINQGVLQDQGQFITQQGLVGPQLIQGQDGSVLEQIDHNQVSGAGLDKDGFSIVQGALGQDQAIAVQLQGQEPTQGLVQSTDAALGQVDTNQRQTLGNFVLGQEQPVHSTENQRNQGYNYPTPFTSLTPGLGVTTVTQSQSTNQGNSILISGGQDFSFPIQHNTQGTEIDGFKGVGNIEENSNILFSQGTLTNQNDAGYQTSQVTGNTLLNSNNNNINDNTILLVDNLSSTVDLRNQNQPTSSTVNIVSGNGESLQGPNYKDPSAGNIPEVNSFSISAPQIHSQPESQSISDISNALSANVASDVNSVGSHTGIIQEYSPPSIEFSSGSNLRENESSFVQKPLSGISVNNILSTSPVSLTDSLKQEVVAPVTQAKPTFTFNAPQNRLSGIDLTALQQGYLPPANEISQSSIGSSVPLTGLSLPSLSPPNTSPFKSSNLTSFTSLGSQSSSSPVTSSKETPLFGLSGSQDFKGSSGITSSSNVNQDTSVGTNSFNFPSQFKFSRPLGISLTNAFTGTSSSPQGSSTGSQTFSSSLPAFSQDNANVNIGRLSNTSPFTSSNSTSFTSLGSQSSSSPLTSSKETQLFGLSGSQASKFSPSILKGSSGITSHSNPNQGLSVGTNAFNFPSQFQSSSTPLGISLTSTSTGTSSKGSPGITSQSNPNQGLSVGTNAFNFPSQFQSSSTPLGISLTSTSTGTSSTGSSGITSQSNPNQGTSVGTNLFSFPSQFKFSTPLGTSLTSTSTGTSSSPTVFSATQGSSTGSQQISSTLPGFSQDKTNNNIGRLSFQNLSPLNLGYLPPVSDSKRNIRQVEHGQSKIYVTPVPNRDQKLGVSEQRSNGDRAFRPSLPFKNDDTSEFMPKSSSNRFGRIFFPSSRHSDGFSITSIDNTRRRSFVPTSSSQFIPSKQYNLSWKS